jgi:hypothetical protein
MKSSQSLRVLAAILLVLACAAFLVTTSGCQKDNPFKPPADTIEGQWGGNGVQFAVDTNSASVLFNCATGTIARPVVLDRQKCFQVEGVYTPTPNQRGFRAVYEGVAGATTLTLKVVLPDDGLEFGPYELIYGERGRISPCGAK